MSIGLRPETWLSHEVYPLGLLQGEVIGYYGRAFKPEKSIDGTTHRSKHRGNLRIPRQDIRQLLLSRLLPDTVQWSHRCLSIQEEEEGHATVTFEDGSSARGDVVVGADGLRSRVRRLRDECLAASRSGGRTGRKEEVKEQQEASGEIDYIGVSVTLGISSFKHPLLQKQGFYVLDGTHRLFTMPFREDEGGTVQTMWQLSFSGLSEGTLLYYAFAEGTESRGVNRVLCPGVCACRRGELAEDVRISRSAGGRSSTHSR